MLIMGTRAAAFTAKVRNLNDYQLRLLHGIVPLPSGVDIANTLKYFSQTLLTVLKDVPASPLDMLKDTSKDIARLALFPSLEYKGLFSACTQLLQAATLIQYGLQPFGTSILQCLGCLLPFLDPDMIDGLPYLVASSLAVLPPTLHQEVINSLCFHILPFTITRCTEEEESYASMSVTSVIMLVFQHSSSVTHHCQLMECLMALKPKVVSDLLCVIAHGTSSARASAAKLLFYYWPPFNANIFEKKTFLPKYSSDWTAFVCQRDMCPNIGNAEAAKVCYDHCISITFSTDRPPPLYLCIECANEIHREHPNQMFYDILHPMQQASLFCENKHCRAPEKSAVSVCFSSECANFNGNRPIRFCQHCHTTRHNNRRGGDHLIHCILTSVWDMSPDVQMYLLESVVSLLKEAQPRGNSKEHADDHKGLADPGTWPTRVDNMTLEESQQLGRYGVWLLIGLCTPRENTPPEIIGRLLSVLFHWFYVTAYVFDDQVLTEGTIEKLKSEHVCSWLNSVAKNHFKVFVSCLLPHPPEYARVGGHWDTQASRTCHLKEGLHQLLCLVPYEVVSVDIWEHIMPRWLEAIVKDVAPRELHQLKKLLSKILDPVLSPLGFDAKKMYRFLSVRFKKTTAKVQEQALNWLQTRPLRGARRLFPNNKTHKKLTIAVFNLDLHQAGPVSVVGSHSEMLSPRLEQCVCAVTEKMLTILEIQVPLDILFVMFNDAVRVMQIKPEEKGNLLCPEEDHSRRSSISPVKEEDSDIASPLSDDEGPTASSKNGEFETDIELQLSCSILMLDLLLKQMELQGSEWHAGISTNLAQDVWSLLQSQLTAQWAAPHICSKRECSQCEARVMWFQLALELVRVMNPENTAHPPDTPVEEASEDGPGRKSPPDSDKRASPKPDVVLSMAMPLMEVHTVGGVLVHMPHFFSQIMTATVETVAEQLDLAPVVAQEKILPAVARQVTISDADVATAKAHVARATLVGEDDQVLSDQEEDQENFWQTSEGRFRFVITELPAHLQLLYTLLTALPTASVPELYHALQCIHLLVLHGDAFTRAAKEDRGFFIWCQENHLIKNLWEMCSSSQSHVCEMTVPLLLHCITLPAGSDTFWNVIQEDFHSSDWKVRFHAVERVTVVARFMDSTPLANEPILQAALANVFCYLISSMDDEKVEVAQRATLYLGTIHDQALKALVACLESQFDSVIVDRPVVLQALYQLHNCLTDRKILSWEFFLNRFDALFIEGQITLEKAGDLTFVRDLRNSDMSSDSFSKRLTRAQEALSRSESSNDGSFRTVRTLTASFGPKWPYKRTMSAPASFQPNQDRQVNKDKEKVYSRQYSAPMLKRKSSRFGLGQFLGCMPEMPDLPPTSGLPDGHIHSLVAGDDLGFAGLSRVLNLEGTDHETTHLLIFLLMQFLSRSDQAFPVEEKHGSRTQALVLRHLYLLMGYSQQENSFYYTPQRLRSSPVLNAFLANLPQVLDQNQVMGRIMASSAMAILQHCPVRASSVASAASLSSAPTHTLWLLESHVRRSWLLALLVIMYKYHYTQQPFRTQVIALLRIILNTISAQHHVCKRVPSAIVVGSASSRSREMSQPSLGGERDDTSSVHDKTESPPPSPMCMSEGKLRGYISKSSGGASALDTHWEEPDAATNHCSGERDDSLWKSESTLRGSPQDGNDGEDGHDRKLSLHEKMKNSWFLGGDDDSQPEERKCGIKQGVMMMVASSVFASTQPVTANGVAAVSNTIPERRSSLASAVASAMQPVVATATVVSVPNKGSSKEAKHMATSSVATVVSPPNVTQPPQLSRLQSLLLKEKDAKADKPKISTPVCPPILTSTTPLSAPWRIDSALSCSLEEGRREVESTSYGSPESPMSKMDLITLGSPIDLESIGSRESFSSTAPLTQLELPALERLLPVGPTPDVSTLTERLHRSLTHECCSNVSTTEEDQSSPRPDDHSPHSTHSTPSALSHCTSKQDSLERPELGSSRATSPRKLTKQMALVESPPEEETSHRYGDKKSEPSSQRDKKRNERGGGKKRRKVGLFSIGSAPRTHLPRRPGSWCGSQQPLLDAATQQACHAAFELKHSAFRIGEDCVLQRCSECGAQREEYSDEELGLCIVILATFIHREPGLAAPFLPQILSSVSRLVYCFEVTGEVIKMIDQENMIETEVGKQASLELPIPQAASGSSKVEVTSNNEKLNKINDQNNDSNERSPSEKSLKIREIQIPFESLQELEMKNKKPGVWVNVKKDKFCSVLSKHELISLEIKCLKEELSTMELDEINLKFSEKVGENVTVNISIKDELSFLVDGLQLPHQLMEAVVKYPRKWDCLGSEADVRLGQVDNTRPLINLEMETHSKNMRRALQLSERLGDSTDCYVSLGPGTRTIPGILREQLDIAVQAVPKVKSAGAQMEPGLPVNAWTQYIYDLEGAEEVQKSSGKDLPPNFKFSEEGYLERALEYNETFNLYTNDYPLLVKGEDETVIPAEASFTPMDALVDVRFVSGLVVVMIAWHPLREGELAILYAPSTNALLHEDLVSSIDIENNSVLLIWSLKNPLKPKLKLDCPREVLIVRWCPVDEYLLVGGTISGQVIIWDLTGKLDEAESKDDLSRTSQRARKMMLNTLEWSQLHLSSIHVKPSALSSLSYSHEDAVTDLQWLTPYYMIDNGGHYKPMIGKRFSLQFMSCGKDGALLIWDLRIVPEEAVKLEKIQKSKNNIVGFRRYSTYNRLLRPLYKIIPQIPNSKKIFSVNRIAVPHFTVKYEKNDKTNSIITDEKQIREWSVFKPCKNYDVDKSIMPERTVLFGTEDGILASIRWEGFSFEKGEEVTAELVDVSCMCPSIHDGPIVETLLSPLLPQVLLTIGGHVLALWQQEKPHNPILIRRSSSRLTSAAWSLIRPSLFRVTRIDGTLEVWDFLCRSDQPILEQSLSGDPLTAIANDPFLLPDGQRLVAVGDFKNALHLLYNPPQFQKCGASDLNLMKKFIKRETELRRRYALWNAKFQSLHKRSKTVVDSPIKMNPFIVRHGVVDDKKHGKKKVMKIDGQTTREEQKMLAILMKKKNLNKTELLAKQQPLRLVQQMAEEKRIKTELKIKKQEEEFEKAAASLMPKVASGIIKESSLGIEMREEIRASLKGVMESWKAQQNEILKPLESETRILESDKVLEEGMARRLAVDISLFSRQKRQERFQARLAMWEKTPPTPPDYLDLSKSLYFDNKTSLALCETLLDGEQPVAQKAGYPWQTEGGPHLPGGAVSVAHQFLRCTLHQLAPNGVFVQIFHTQIPEKAKIEFFRGIAQALFDFPELPPSTPLQLLLETLNTKKSLTAESVAVVCRNMTLYLEMVPMDLGPAPVGSPWQTLLVQLDLFFRRVVLLLPTMDDILAPVSLMPFLLKQPGISSCKAILDPFAKVLSYAIQNTVVDAHVVVELCQLCGRAFSRDREKLALTRMLIIELVQALKFKTTMPDTNFITLINFVIQDTGNCLVQTGLISCSPDSFTSGTNAAEIMRQHLADALDFLADFHTVSKIKSFCQGDTPGLNEDTLGGALKSGVAQYVALEMSRGARDNRAVARHLPWLYNIPSSLQQGPKEFLECMGHVRLLSWLLLGGLFQSLSIHAPCTPVPPEASCHVADHIQVILAGFAEQSKASVLHMSSLFHAFILCQLWTVYLEAGANSNPPGSEPHIAQNTILLDFWGKVTPCILQLVAHSKVLAEMVNLHFLSLLEALLEVNASILGKLMPLWTPVLYAHHTQLPGHLQVRLQNCRHFPPTTPTNNSLLAKWLQRLQFKMGQIELQSWAATQFYSV